MSPIACRMDLDLGFIPSVPSLVIFLRKMVSFVPYLYQFHSNGGLTKVLSQSKDQAQHCLTSVIIPELTLPIQQAALIGSQLYSTDLPIHIYFFHIIYSNLQLKVPLNIYFLTKHIVKLAFQPFARSPDIVGGSQKTGWQAGRKSQLAQLGGPSSKATTTYIYTMYEIQRVSRVFDASHL